MRPAIRLLAQVKPQFLEAGAPTGLAGLATHGTPRSTLLYLYSTTLDKLKQFPEHSVYRQSTEALTKHRMSIVEKVLPTGLEQWQERVKPLLEQHPEAFKKIPNSSSPSQHNIIWREAIGPIRGGVSVSQYKIKSEDEQHNEKMRKFSYPEGARNEQEETAMATRTTEQIDESMTEIPHIEPEPPLSSEQIRTIENEISAGLIEEVIQVAEGELKVANVMAESQAWEDLEEKPQEGQWVYHDRGTHTGKTQQP